MDGGRPPGAVRARMLAFVLRLVAAAVLRGLAVEAQCENAGHCSDESTCILSCSCRPCRSGFYCYQGSSVCSADEQYCRAGSYQPNRGQGTCIYCTVGKYQPYKGHTSCNYCSAGQFQSHNDRHSTSCSNCVPGKHQPSRG